MSTAPNIRDSSGAIGSLGTSAGLLPYRSALTRLASLAALFVAELLLISTRFDGATLGQRAGLLGAIRLTGPWILRGIVGFCAVYASLAILQKKTALAAVVREVARSSVAWGWLAAHLAALATVLILGSRLYGGADVSDLMAAAWLGTGLLAVAAGSLAFFPAPLWRDFGRATGNTWMYALTAAALACLTVGLSQSMWQSAAGLTFQLVQLLLRPLIPALTADPAHLLIRGRTFGVIINQECSGLEGTGLILVFGLVWLWLFRREFRFPQALLLLPAGAVILYLLNAVRIAALLLIGDAGARQIAAEGFHSQAGWILFNSVAFGLAVFARRLPWLSVGAPAPTAAHEATENPTAAYLAPFLAILASGMLSRAASGSFEWLYPLRFLAAAVMLWMFRRKYKELNWRFGWPAVATGGAVFLAWIGLDRFGGMQPLGMPGALSGSAAPVAAVWILCRVLAATLTVPAAEELAFRGYAMRRLTSADFEGIALRGASFFGVFASAAAFGLMHGERWLGGVIAGVLYALLARRTNRIGDAVAAHAVTNALLAAAVLLFGQWQYW